MPVQKGSHASPTSEFEILQGDLAFMLYEATKDLTNVEYLFGTTLEKVVLNGPEIVKVELISGETNEYDLLVVADGQWSRVRKKCLPAECIKVVDKNMYCVYSTIPRIASDNDWWNIYFALDSRIVSTRPDPYGATRAFFSRMPCNDAQKQARQAATRSDRKTQMELLRREFVDAGWQSQRLLDAMEQADDFYFQAV